METKALLGRPVTDIYGRHIGRIIGIDKSMYGEFDGVQVEGNNADIISVKARQIGLTPASVTITPEWKLNAAELIKELTILRKRVSALDSLKNSDGIDPEIYAELLASQKSDYADKLDSADVVADSLKARLGSISAQISSLTRHLINAKLDRTSGRLDEASLKLTQSFIEPSLRPLLAEKNDLSTSLKGLEEVLPARVTLS